MAELTLRELIATEITNCVEESRKSGVVRNFTYADNIRNILRDRIKTMGLTQTEIFTAQNEDACSFVAMQEHKITAKSQLDKVLKELE